MLQSVGIIILYYLQAIMFISLLIPLRMQIY